MAYVACEQEIDLEALSSVDRMLLEQHGALDPNDVRRWVRCPNPATWFAVAGANAVRIPRCDHHGYPAFLRDAVRPECLPISEWDAVGAGRKVFEVVKEGLRKRDPK